MHLGFDEMEMSWSSEADISESKIDNMGDGSFINCRLLDSGLWAVGHDPCASILHLSLW